MCTLHMFVCYFQPSKDMNPNKQAGMAVKEHTASWHDRQETSGHNTAQVTVAQLDVGCDGALASWRR